MATRCAGTLKLGWVWVLMLSMMAVPWQGFAQPGCGMAAGGLHLAHVAQADDCHGGQKPGTPCPHPCPHCLICADSSGSPPSAHPTLVTPVTRPVTLETTSPLPAHPYYELLRPPRG